MKKIVFLVVFAISICYTTFAGQLGQNESGFFYVQDDGTLAINKWVELDLDGDGLLEYHYFNEAGLMAVNTTTPDGYQVNERGQWVENGTPNKTVDIKLMTEIAETIYIKFLSKTPSTYKPLNFGYWSKASEVEFQEQNVYGAIVRRYLLVDKVNSEDHHFNLAEDGAIILYNNKPIGRLYVVTNKATLRPNDYTYTYEPVESYRVLNCDTTNFGYRPKSTYEATQQLKDQIDYADFYFRNRRKKYSSDWE